MNRDDLQNMRRNYQRFSLDINELNDNPLEQFKVWLKEAVAEGFYDPNAMVLSTVAADGQPQSRIVLLKEIDDKGLIFFTNYLSDKAVQIVGNPLVSLNFWWDKMERQVRICGWVEKVSRVHTEAYFESRPRDSRLGAWASEQSAKLGSYDDLTRVFDELQDKFADKEIPCPEHWGGYRVVPSKYEFWQGRPNRLHDRIIYEFEVNQWHKHRLNP